jgi:DNA-binding CsgD family transcriptional regulator
VEDHWPLVGRDAELEVVTRCVERRRGVVIAGVSGVGKTRLAREAAAVARSGGMACEVLAATPTTRTIPFGVLAHVERPQHAGAFASPLAALRHSLLSRAAGAPLLLVVDDAHALDDASAALVHSLAHAADATVVATVRTGETCPDAVVALWKDGLCDRLDLQPLSPRETAALLEAALGQPCDGRSAFLAWEATRGNLLFLRELVRDGLQAGTLLVRRGRWHITALQAPRWVGELVARQVGALEPASRRALELVAFGEPLEWALLCRLAPTVSEAVASGLIAVEASGRRSETRFAHPLTGDVVRRLTLEPRRQEVLAELAAAVRATGGRRHHDTLRVVDWLDRAGRDVGAAELTGAASAVMAIDPARAEHFARRAVAAGGGAAAAVCLAQVLMLARRAPDALAALDAARPATPADACALALMRANVLTFGAGRGEEAAAFLDDLAATAKDPTTRARLVSHTVPMLLFAGRIADARARARSLLADATVAAPDRARAAITAVTLEAVSARPVTAARLAAEAAVLVGAGMPELPFAHGQIGAGLILAHQWAGDLDAADALARAAYDDGVRRGADLLRGASALYLGVGALWRGRARTAVGLLTEAVDALEALDVGMLGWAVDNLRAAVAMAGTTVAEPDPPWRHPLYETERIRLHAVAAAASGDSRRAVTLARRAAEEATRRDLAAQVAFARFDEARYGAARSAAPALDAVAASAEGALIPTMARTAAALAARDAEALEAASGWFADAGFTLYAAETARAAALCHQRAGLRARASAAERRARNLAADCEGARTPLLALNVGVVAAALTRREAEIARLAAEGASNATIAERLGLSVRTVETHLQRAYAKLGVHRRADLASAL